MGREWSGIARNTFRNNFGHKNKPRSQFGVPKLDFFLKAQFLERGVFVKNACFNSLTSRSSSYNMFVWTVGTILGFRTFLTLTWFLSSKSHFFGKMTFWDFCENEQILWRCVLKSPSLLVSTPQGLLFLKNRHLWNFEMCPFGRKCTFAHIWCLRTPSGGPREGLWGHLWLQGLGTQSGRKNMQKPSCFSAKVVRPTYFAAEWRRRHARSTAPVHKSGPRFSGAQPGSAQGPY